MIIDLGLTDYEDAYRIQKEFVARRKAGEIEDSVIVTEHSSVFTIGRIGKIANMLEREDVLKQCGIKVLRVDRGGDITFHGPGQLVIYPIVDLRNRGSDLHQYLRLLEEIAITSLRRYSVAGERVSGKTGIWVERKKIGSVGIAASNWVTFHGLSINVNVDLRFFKMINPCGMKDCAATSLETIIGRHVDMTEFKDIALSETRKILGLNEYGVIDREEALVA